MVPNIDYIICPLLLDLTTNELTLQYRREFALNMFKPEHVDKFLSAKRVMTPYFFDVFRSQERTCM